MSLTLTLTLKSYGGKKYFNLRGVLAAYTKITYTKQVTSNNGKIDLYLYVKLLILYKLLASVTLTFSRSFTKLYLIF